MEDQLSAFLDFLAVERNYSDNTIAAYRNDLGQFMKWITLNHSEIEIWPQVSFEVTKEYSEWLKQQSYTASSVARKVAAIKSFFHFLLARAFISSDPTSKLESPKVKKRLPKTLSADEVERLLQTPTAKQTPKHLRDRALLHVLYATGMRVTEVVSLKLDNVKLSESLITFPAKDNRQRVLPIDQITLDILSDYLENGRPHLVKNKNEQALFLNHRGKQLTRQGLWLIIKAYANEAGLGDKVTPHTLRHSFAAHSLNSGTELREIQQLLGHANISTTQIYSQLHDVREKDAS